MSKDTSELVEKVLIKQMWQEEQHICYKNYNAEYLRMILVFPGLV